MSNSVFFPHIRAQILANSPSQVALKFRIPLTFPESRTLIQPKPRIPGPTITPHAESILFFPVGVSIFNRFHCSFLDFFFIEYDNYVILTAVYVLNSTTHKKSRHQSLYTRNKLACTNAGQKPSVSSISLSDFDSFR